MVDLPIDETERDLIAETLDILDHEEAPPRAEILASVALASEVRDLRLLIKKQHTETVRERRRLGDRLIERLRFIR